MLNMEKSKTIQDIIHGTIVYSGLESEIIRTPIFTRLQRVSQSSLAFLTFPSNKVKRFEHFGVVEAFIAKYGSISDSSMTF